MFHNYQDFVNVHSNLPIGVGLGFIAIVLGVWELVWKGYGLWKAAQKNDTAWFVAILILNTAGILPILYIYLFSQKSKKTS